MAGLVFFLNNTILRMRLFIPGKLSRLHKPANPLQIAGVGKYLPIGRQSGGFPTERQTIQDAHILFITHNARFG
jgi:hypothetical protein